MHESMIRMHRAAKVLLGIEGQSNLAVTIGESTQTVNNWESRGVSRRGALKAARTIGCSTEWLLSGDDDMRATTKGVSSTGVSPQAAELAALFDLLPPDRIKRVIAFNAASKAILDVLQQQ